MTGWWHRKRRQWHAFLMRPQSTGPAKAHGVRALMCVLFARLWQWP
jgi:hypothetical protein